MAIADIERTIIREAEQEAAQVVAEAKKEKQDKVDQAVKEIAAEKKALKEKISDGVKQVVEQRRTLAKLETTQEVLQVKRNFLEQLKKDIMADILDKEEYLVAFFTKILEQISPVIAKEKVSFEVASPQEKALQKALRDQKIEGKIKSRKDWPAGRFEIVEERSRMDCSLELFLAEQLQAKEREIAEKLFV